MNKQEIEAVMNDLIGLRMELEGLCNTLDKLTAEHAKNWLSEN